MFSDPKTLITGIITFIVAGLAHFNIVIPESYTSIIVAAGMFIFGLFAKDAKSS